MSKKKYEVKNRPSISDTINNTGLTDLKDEFLEVTLWSNGEGIDIYFSKGCVDKLPIRFSLSYEEAKKLRKLIKASETVEM